MQLPKNGDVLETLLSKHHGWWWDFIVDRVDRRGRTRPAFAKQTQFSEGYINMYGYSSAKIGVEAIVHEKDREKVVSAMKRTMRPNSTAYSGTIRTITASNVEKLVEVYLRRFALPDGRAVIASVHSDLTISSEQQWIDRTVLDRLQAFVFVKRWNPVSRHFEFRYVNDLLAEELGESSSVDAIGKTDKSYFRDVIQNERFYEADMEVASTTDRSLIVVREEVFHPMCQDAARRLLTFKTPFSSPSHGSLNGFWDVLGIAVDITSVTDLLREMIERPQEGLYIKDDKGRYQFVNRTLMRLFGVDDESDIINRTFDEVMSHVRSSIPGLGNVAELTSTIADEDVAVLRGGRTVQVRTSVRDGSEWVTEKTQILTGRKQTPHILGATAPLFPGHLGEMLDRIPQRVGIKKVCHERKTPDQIRIVWANKSFLSVHECESIDQIRGKNDFQLWDDAEIAQKYRDKDIAAVRVHRDLVSATDWQMLGPQSQWIRTVSRLKDEGLWEYRELQRKRNVVRVLQTTKWVEAIHGELYVVVVYSDVTKGDSELQQYHDMTVHTLRNAVSPLGVALAHLNTAISLGCDFADVHLARECISDADENVSSLVNYHLKLFNRRSDPSWTEIQKVVEMIHSVARKSSRLGLVDTTSRIPDRKWGGRSVFIDLEMMEFVVTELVRNAAKSCIARRFSLKRAGAHGGSVSEYKPCVTLVVDQVGDRLTVCVEDNGNACVDSHARQELFLAYQGAKADPFEPKRLCLGVAFCVLVVQDQGCDIDVSTCVESVQVKITMPFVK